MNKNLVSIIIPTYNRANLIIPTVESILEQDYDSIEVIVVDDGSTDDTPTIVSKYIETNKLENLYYFKTPHSGAPSARNFGYYKSRGDYIIFFDSDDIMLVNRISIQMEEIKKNNADCSVCGFYFNSISGNSYIPPISGAESPVQLFVKKKLLGSTQCWLFNREYVAMVNGFDTSLECLQDVDLTFRILLKNPKIAIVQQPLTIFMTNNNKNRISFSRSKLKCLTSIVNYHCKIINYLIKKNNFKLLIYEIYLFSKILTYNIVRGDKSKELSMLLKPIHSELKLLPGIKKAIFLSILSSLLRIMLFLFTIKLKSRNE